MSESLRLLMVEDSEDDAELLLRELRRAGYAVTWERVDTPPAMQAALERQAWDIVTSDHAMPRFSAPAALALLKEVCPGLPFIIVSNEIDLNLAVSLMKAGARDYIQKRELAKAAPAIQRELREVEMLQKRQQAEAALRESESRYRGVFETVADALFVLDQETGAILDVNQAACRLYGYTRDEMLQLKSPDLSAEPEQTAHALKAGLTRITPRLHRRKDGAHFPVDIRASYSEYGGRRLLVAAIRDMSDRMEAESALRESERKYRDLAESLPLIVYEIDRHGNLTFANHAAFKAFGYGTEELERGIHIFDWVAPEDLERFRQTLEPLAALSFAPPAPFTLRRKDGSTFTGEIYSSPVVRDQLTLGFRGIVIDITERQHAETALRESERRYRDLVELLPLTVYECDLEGRLTFINRHALQTFGYPLEDFERGLTIFRVLTSEGHATARQQMELILKNIPSGPINYIVSRKDGHLFPVEVFSAPILRDGQPVGFLGVLQDITARKQLEKELEDARALVEAAFEQAPVPMVLVSIPSLSPHIVNSAAMEILGIEDEPRQTGKSLFDIKQTWQDFDASGLPLPLQEMPLALALKEISTRNKEYRILRKDGTSAWELVTAAPIYNSAGELIAALLVFPDITERKQAEELIQAQNEQLLAQNQELRAQGELLLHVETELRESQERYQMLFEHASEGIAVCQDNRFRFINPALGQLFGYTAEVLLTRDLISFVHPDDRAAVAGHHLRCLQGQPAAYAFRVINDRGHTLWLAANSVRIEWENAPATLVFYTNITSHKQLEAALQESTQRYRALAEAAQDMIFIIGPDDQVEYVNPLAASYFGREPQALVGQPRASLFPSAKNESQWPSLKTVFETGQPLYHEIVVQFPGREAWVATWLVPLRNASGQVTAVMGSARDITEHKRAEEALRESNQALSAIVAASPVAIMALDRDKRVIKWSPAAERLFGWTEAEVLGRFTPIVPPDQLEEFEADFNGLLQTGNPYSRDVRRQNKAGQRLYLGLSTAPLRDAQGNITGVVGLMVDIAERQNAEAALRESEARMRQIASSLREAVWLRDTRTLALLYVNPAYETIWGRTCESFYQNPTSFVDAVLPEDKPRILQAIQKQSQGIFFNEEYRILRPDGAVRWVWGRTFPVYDAAGEVYRMTAIVEDITARKQAEAELRQRNQELETIGRLINAITANLNLQEILDQALRGALELAGLEGGTLWLVNPERATLTLAAAQNTSPGTSAELHAEEVKVGDGLCGQVAQTGQALILWDSASSSEYATREELRAEGLRFQAAFPLLVKGSVSGVLCLFTRGDVRPSPRSLELIQQLCGPIALAIDNARLYAQAQRHAAELEQRVEERTMQLAAINQELEAFSYSVAHDLRAPLRSIDGYSQALLEDYAGQLAPQAERHLQRLRAASARMGELIEDLLELSRLNRGELDCTLLDLSAMARTIAEELQRRDPHRQAEFIIADGMIVRADARLLRAALENLLGNAWKFTAQRPVARIEFGERRQKRGNLEERLYFVRDNGAGFDMALADKLFKAFQRLHPADQFPGTGIGLATVKRILTRHGGRVWAEGAVDQGATFYFTL